MAQGRERAHAQAGCRRPTRRPAPVTSTSSQLIDSGKRRRDRIAVRVARRSLEGEAGVANFKAMPNANEKKQPGKDQGNAIEDETREPESREAESPEGVT